MPDSTKPFPKNSTDSVCFNITGSSLWVQLTCALLQSSFSSSIFSKFPEQLFFLLLGCTHQLPSKANLDSRESTKAQIIWRWSPNFSFFWQRPRKCAIHKFLYKHVNLHLGGSQSGKKWLSGGAFVLQIASEAMTNLPTSSRILQLFLTYHWMV